MWWGLWHFWGLRPCICFNPLHICDKFINYQNDNDAKTWLTIMGDSPKKIQKLSASQIPVRINLEKAMSLGVSQEKYDETIKFKKANKSAGFNQVDKRPVLTYQQIWGFDDNVAKWLRLFTGDILPQEVLLKQELKNIKDDGRLFLTEIPKDALEHIIDFFQDNITLVISDILRGRGGLSAEWFLVTRTNDNNLLNWVLKDINTVVNFYVRGGVSLSPRGSLKIGRVTMQRKGGTPDPTSLQFKINPLDLFEE